MVVGVMIAGERVAARRYRLIADGIDATGTVTARGLTSGTHKSTVFDVAYVDADGRKHTLRRIALTGHVTIGSHIAVRYQRNDPAVAAPAPQHVTSPKWQVVAAFVVFAALGLALGATG